MSVSDADVRVDEVRQAVKRQTERLANVERAVRRLCRTVSEQTRDAVISAEWRALLAAIPDPDAPKVAGIIDPSDPPGTTYEFGEMADAPAEPADAGPKVSYIGGMDGAPVYAVVGGQIVPVTKGAPDAPAEQASGVHVVAEPSAFVEAVRTALHSSATADEFAARVGVIFAETDAPAPEPEAGRRWWVTYKTGCVGPIAEVLAQEWAGLWNARVPADAPYLAIFAPNADAARKKYAEQVAGREDAAEGTADAAARLLAWVKQEPYTAFSMDARDVVQERDHLRGRVATLKQERDQIDRSVNDALAEMPTPTGGRQTLAQMVAELRTRAESAEATVAELRKLCGEASAFFRAGGLNAEWVARLAAASRGEAV